MAPKQTLFESSWVSDEQDRRLVCRRCHTVMPDCEPVSPYGEFWHGDHFKDLTPNPCRNRNKRFTAQDLPSKEVEPFRRKRDRRVIGRAKKRQGRSISS